MCSLAAHGKVALLVGNNKYISHQQLSCSVADIRILKRALTEAGFKVSVSKLVVAG